MKGMKNVEVASPVPTAKLKMGTGGARSGTVNVSGGAKVPSTRGTSQPNTKSGKVVSPAKSK